MDLPDVDPWSTEGIALARFEELKDIAIEAAEVERQAFAELYRFKKKTLKQALVQDDLAPEEVYTSAQRKDEIQRLTDLALEAKAAKLKASEEAQAARIAFNEIVNSRPEDKI